jgi:hypothetical protein
MVALSPDQTTSGRTCGGAWFDAHRESEVKVQKVMPALEMSPITYLLVWVSYDMI